MQRDESYYKCLCGTHVHKGTFILSILGIIGNIPLAFMMWGSRTGAYFIVMPIGHIISLIAYICLLIGNRKEIPGLYLPFFVINVGLGPQILDFQTLCLGLTVLAAIGYYVVGGFFLAHKIHIDDISFEEERAAGIVCIAIATIYILSVLIQIYFFGVVYRGYRYLKDVLLNPVPIHPVHINTQMGPPMGNQMGTQMGTQVA